MADDQLYKELAAKIGMGDSAFIPRLFEMAAPEEEARLLLALPGTAAEAGPKIGLDVAKTEGLLADLYHKGLAFMKKTPEGTIYRMSRDLMQFHDASILWPEAPRAFLDLWQEFMETEWPAFSEIVSKMLPRPVTRIVPVGESMDSRQQVLAYEDVQQMIDEAEVIAVTNCTCRLTARKCDRPVEICLQTGKAGSYAIDRGTGRSIDKAEAMDLLRKAEEAGLIHTTMNRSGETHFICNCCSDCCMTFPMLIDRNLKMCDPSRYAAEIDAGVCTGCGDCLERCYFGALSMDDAEGKAVILEEECMGCGRCKVVCSEGAIALKEVREAGFIPS